MTARLTDAELDELERLDVATWPAPWDDLDIDLGLYITCDAGGVEHRIGPDGYSVLLAARNALPPLLAEVRELRARVARVEGYRERMHDACKAIAEAVSTPQGRDAYDALADSFVHGDFDDAIFGKDGE